MHTYNERPCRIVIEAETPTGNAFVVFLDREDDGALVPNAEIMATQN